ncbi:hypothetical protein Vadar_001225 [Vaccinium darrowii]|uniref:Uncharacterized protein n=1 Tax=Vaccinium darrowii TaxID=229202 RepID=A0ACB7WWL2_9ERIC|nr:hypothetical protein Vadar_001225 [Vaccinium darrowii]
MGFVGFLKFAFKCFDLIAWPLFGLGCPLYASIRAIENNSNSEMRNLVAYWILFSIVSLFELAFVKLIEWLAFWPYMKLVAMCLLVLPDFNGASYAYECLLRPCLSVDPRAVIKYLLTKKRAVIKYLLIKKRAVIKYFIRSKEEKSLSAESFRALAERYAQENGYEALEKLLDLKTKHTKPDIGMEEIQAISNTAEKETAAAIQSKYQEPIVGKMDARAVEQPEKSPVAATKLSEFREPRVGKENANVGQLKDENPAVATEQSKYQKPLVGKMDAIAVEQPEKSPIAAAKLSKLREPSVGKENATMGQLKDENPAVATEQIKFEEPNLVQNEKKTVAAGEIKEKTVGAPEEEKKAVVISSEKVQREWTCALCQLTTPTEKILDSHLQGRKHKAKVQQLEASMQANKNKASSSSAASPEPKKTLDVDRPNDNSTNKQEYKVRANVTNEQCIEKEVDNAGCGMDQSKFWCSICDLKLLSENNLASHLGGKKHLSKAQQHMINAWGGGYY